MSKLTKAERDELPESDFGDPQSRLFPVVDQDDLESAAHLLGKAKNPEKVKSRLIAIAKRKGLKLPKAWGGDGADTAGKFSAADGATPDGLMGGVAFDLGPAASTDGEYVVYPNSRLFVEGDYPDKQFSMSREELWAAVEQFTEPVPIGLEHIDTVYSGKLGEVREIRLGPDGVLFGTVAIAKPADAMLDPDKRKVSCYWDRKTKTLNELSLVVSPRIADAALFATFSGRMHKTPHGQSMVQDLHDMVASATVCDPKNSRTGAGFHSRKEKAGLQGIHDDLVGLGARCSVYPPSGMGPGAMYSADPPSPTSLSRITPMLSELLAIFSKGAKGADGAITLPPDLVDESLALATAQVPDPEPTPTPAPPPKPQPRPAPTPEPAASFAASPEGRAMKAEMDRLKAETDRLKAANEATELRRIDDEAARFAADEVRACRALPAEQEDLRALFRQAAVDDRAHAVSVGFSANGENKTGGRADLLRAAVAKRPPHNLYGHALTGEDLPEGASVVAFSRGDERDRKPSEARKKELLAMTSLGRAVLKSAAGDGR